MQQAEPTLFQKPGGAGMARPLCVCWWGVGGRGWPLPAIIQHLSDLTSNE